MTSIDVTEEYLTNAVQMEQLVLLVRAALIQLAEPPEAHQLRSMNIQELGLRVHKALLEPRDALVREVDDLREKLKEVEQERNNLKALDGQRVQQINNLDHTASSRYEELEALKEVLADTQRARDMYHDSVLNYSSQLGALKQQNGLFSNMQKRLHDDLYNANQLVKAGQRFKDFVHQFLTDRDVPYDPYPLETAEHGCRISGRLKWVFTDSPMAWALIAAEKARTDQGATP